MKKVQFQPIPGENIHYRAEQAHDWYLIAWKIVVGLVGFTFLTFILFELLGAPAQHSLAAFLPGWVAEILTKFMFLGLLPAAGLAWIAEDVTSMFNGELILTDQRIWVRGSPYAWSQFETPLADITSVAWRRDAVFIRQKSTRKMHILIFGEGKYFVKAYNELLGRS